jgi:hypothetical protein
MIVREEFGKVVGQLLPIPAYKAPFPETRVPLFHSKDTLTATRIPQIDLQFFREEMIDMTYSNGFPNFVDSFSIPGMQRCYETKSSSHITQIKKTFANISRQTIHFPISLLVVASHTNPEPFNTMCTLHKYNSRTA